MAYLLFVTIADTVGLSKIGKSVLLSGKDADMHTKKRMLFHTKSVLPEIG